MSSVQLRIDPAGLPGVSSEGWRDLRSPVRPWLPLAVGGGLALVDTLLVLGAFLLAHWVRFIVPDEAIPALGLEQYGRMGLAVGLGTIILLGAQGLYDVARAGAGFGRLYQIISALSTALVVAVAVSFFLGEQGFSRLWFAAGWAFAVTGLWGWHGLYAALYPTLRAAIAPATRVLIVGANPLGHELAHELGQGAAVVGYVDNGSDLPAGGELPLLGPIAQLERLVQQHAIDEIVVALPTHRREQLLEVIARGFHQPVQVKLVPRLGNDLPRRVELTHLGGHPCLGFAPVARVSGLKRVCDLALTSVALLSLAPLLVGIALAIRLDSPGSVLYRQQRVGKDGRRFSMLKFRSMREDADRLLEQLANRNEATGPLFKMRQDPRVTRVGRVLRRWSLDELPQLVNVLRGDMSLVGPRPPLPKEVAEYEEWQHARLRAVPGLTGLWQVSGRSEVPFHDMVRLDLHYIRNWSLALDAEILLRTIPAVLSSRGAY